MASNKKKQDEKHLKILRDMVALPCNKQCFDCHQRGPTYVNMTIGSFVCTSCSGILRGLNPPHRVKSISMASFSPEELESLKSHSNELCRKVYLGLYDSRSWPEPDSKDEQRVKDFMVQKYENKRWYNAPTQEMKDEAKRMNEAAINKQSQTKPLRSLLGDKTPKLVLQNNHSTQANRQHPHPVSSAHGVIGTIPMPTSAAVSQQTPVTVNTTQKLPVQASQPKSNMDIFGDFGSDPFGSSAPISAPVAPIASSVPFPVAGPGSNANTPTGFSSITSSSTTTPTVSDKYSAFADLFSDPVPASAEASRPNDIWSSNSSTVPAPAPANTLGGGGMNWGGGMTDTSAGSLSWGGTSSGVANPFSSAATQSPMGFGQKTQIGMGQSPQMMNQPSQIGTGMGQTGHIGIGQMGMTPTSVANPFASGLADLSGKPAQPVGGTGFASWGNPPAQPSNNDFFGHNGNLASTGFGTSAQPASGFWPADPSQGFGAPAPSVGAWNQPQPVNPFMQAANTQPVAPRGNSSNPFL